MNFLKSLPGPIGKFFRYREYKMMIKRSASFVLEELAKGINELISDLEKNTGLDSKKKEILKFELMILAFWFLQVKNIFPATWRNSLFDQIHEQYLEALRRHGHNFKTPRISETFNARYTLYWEILNKEADDFSKLGVTFAKNISNVLKSNPTVLDISIPILFLAVLKPKFEMFRQMVKDN